MTHDRQFGENVREHFKSLVQKSPKRPCPAPHGSSGAADLERHPRGPHNNKDSTNLAQSAAT